MAEASEGTGTTTIQNWIQEQGFWLEHYTQRTLQTSGARASLGRVYRDPQTGKLRDIDVLSDPQLTFAPLSLRAVVECKAGKSGAWIIRQANLRESEIGAHAIASPRVGEFLAANSAILRSAFPLSEPIGFSVLVVGKDKGGFDALQQTLSAAHGALSLASGSTFVHPVLVIAAPLYGLSYDELDQEKLTPLPWWRVVHSRGEHPALTDVVQHEFLRDYAAGLRSSFDTLLERFRDFGWTEDE